MTNNQDQINRLHDKLETLLKRQEIFSKEVSDLKEEITRLKGSGTKKPLAEEKPVKKGSFGIQHEYGKIAESKKLYRNIDNKVIGGVCSALGEYFNMNKILVRLLFILGFLFFGVGFILYLVLWVAIPLEPKSHEPTAKRQVVSTETHKHTTDVTGKRPVKAVDIEKFIGENLINKIGIAVVIIGVAIG
ncbi:MAG: PspC domain-containing protein, partial [Bacteroidia bacterium]|nr:PspC domain-containing protein [Bacteroidia bacterium]